LDAIRTLNQLVCFTHHLRNVYPSQEKMAVLMDPHHQIWMDRMWTARIVPKLKTWHLRFSSELMESVVEHVDAESTSLQSVHIQFKHMDLYREKKSETKRRQVALECFMHWLHKCPHLQSVDVDPPEAFRVVEKTCNELSLPLKHALYISSSTARRANKLLSFTKFDDLRRVHIRIGEVPPADFCIWIQNALLSVKQFHLSVPGRISDRNHDLVIWMFRTLQTCKLPALKSLELSVHLGHCELGALGTQVFQNVETLRLLFHIRMADDVLRSFPGSSTDWDRFQSLQHLVLCYASHESVVSSLNGASERFLQQLESFSFGGDIASPSLVECVSKMTELRQLRLFHLAHHIASEGKVVMLERKSESGNDEKRVDKPIIEGWSACVFRKLRRLRLLYFSGRTPAQCALWLTDESLTVLVKECSHLESLFVRGASAAAAVRYSHILLDSIPSMPSLGKATVLFFEGMADIDPSIMKEIVERGQMLARTHGKSLKFE
jgi:hypothetical protein